ncbi:MAG: phosphoserine phosphatase SerB [Filomicrobium sp.]
MPAFKSQVLVITAPGHAPCLNDTLTDTITRFLAKDAVIERRWLAQGEAWEVEFVNQADGGEHIRQQAATALLGLPVDINILPGDAELRRKRLLVADMDSTIIEQECIDEIADFANVRDEVSEITERAMRGELDFEEAINSRVALLEGLPISIVDEIIENRLTIMPGAQTLVATMKANGAKTALVSGGFTDFTSRISKIVGFETNQANVLETADDHLTGTVKKPILGKEAKLAALNAYASEAGIPLTLTLAVGDGANDLAMINAAGLGVAYRAKQIVAEAAEASIRHGNLETLLYLQGYQRKEFVD